MSEQPLHYWNATDLAAAIRRRELSAVEVMRAHLDRIEEVNPKVNSIVAPIPASAALAAAREADSAVARGDELGVLHGLPTAVKDLLDVRGLPTTYGSAAFADAAPSTRDSLLVTRLREAGAIVIGKTNTPEHGVGTLTFNPVYGVTRNPWNLATHGGGSSGAAAALAAGMLPVADGSDSGGSLRYPSSFCNTVGLRTTAGRVPADAPGSGWSPHSVLGPMARNSLDAGLMLAAIAGPDIAAPLSIEDAPEVFAALSPARLDGVRIGWSKDADGLPVDPEVRAAYALARTRLEALGAVIEDVEIDFSDADEAWEIVEMFGFFSFGWPGVEATPERYRPDFVRNVQQGGAYSAKEIAHGFALRTEIYRRTARLLRDYELFVTPATPVTAPPADVEWVEEIDGVKFDRYFRWQRMANRITMTGHPALVTPGGFTASGMPFGLQLVGRMRAEASLLAYGAAIEAGTGFTQLRPRDI
ncbi:amidase [Acrocarpospora pleiomorpha]|uniref:Amidase n=1 Tax=Acrocarpospora pleiomorpha TaxID=90975 RepID=A0A5M3XZF6_9ACTN|nr:amidase family protein [Acrocarpospora pleiomorpha]GES24931.1 amidase [Acrocarpospora pleiomorpha]